MKTNRKNFIKSTCMAGAALCCFGSWSLGAKNEDPEPAEKEPNEPRLQQNYILKLIAGMGAALSEPEISTLMKNCAIVHYENLKMDEILSGYIGKSEEFLTFLSENWGWKIDHNKETGIIIADENKNYCVCPMINHKCGMVSGAICYCSEGFAEKMFSAVFEKVVKATVIASVIRGNESCKYKIELK